MSIVKLPSVPVVAAVLVPDTHFSVTVPAAIDAPVAAVPLTLAGAVPVPPPQAAKVAARAKAAAGSQTDRGIVCFTGVPFVKHPFWYLRWVL